MSNLKKIPLILAVLTVAISLAAASVQSVSAAANCAQWHTVQRGEYLVQIARLYNTSWRTLADINNLENPSRVYPGQKLCVDPSGSGSSPLPVSQPVSSSGGRIYALSVVEDKSVSLRGTGLWANSRYSVYLNRYLNNRFSPVFAGTAFTDKNGAFTTAVRIPKELVDIAKIGVRIDNGRGSRVSNWFINATADDYTGGEGSPALSFSIVSVEEDEWVKIKTSNLPPNVTFKVLIGKAGTKGVDGILVGSMLDDDGGGVRATFEIPDDLQGKSRLDIRLENKALGMSYFVTFENEDTR
jgi:LysM repeat protein